MCQGQKLPEKRFRFGGEEKTSADDEYESRRTPGNMYARLSRGATRGPEPVAAADCAETVAERRNDLVDASLRTA